MVSGDVAFRIVGILAFIGAVPLSILGIFFVASGLEQVITMIGEYYTTVFLAAVAAIFVFIIALLIVRYPVSRGGLIGLRVGLVSSALVSIISWGWLTYTYASWVPRVERMNDVLEISIPPVNIATLMFLDFWLAAMAILVALNTITERM